MTNLQHSEQEIWKDIKDYEGLYQVSNFGRVKRLANSARCLKDRLLKPKFKKSGYAFVILANLGAKSCHIHRLVAAAFIPNPENKPQVNHINVNKAFNRVENLEWVTQTENAIHARQNIVFKNGNKKGSEHNGAQPVVQLSEEGQELFVWGSIIEASRYYKIHAGAICNSMKNNAKSLGCYWRDTTKDYYLNNKNRFTKPPNEIGDRRSRDMSKAVEARADKINAVTKNEVLKYGIECLKEFGTLRRDIYEEYARKHKVPSYRFVIRNFNSFDNFKIEVRKAS